MGRGSIIYPNGNEKYSEYTVDNLLKKTTYKNEATFYTYDYNPTHTLKSVVDNQGRTFNYSYNEVGWLTSSTDSVNPSITGGFTVDRAYDKAGRITGVKPTLDDTTTYEYNLRGDLTALLMPGTLETTFTYDDARQRTSVSTPDGTKRLYAFDEAGRVTSVENSATSSNQSFSYTYDGNGNITKENNTRYAYDVVSRLKEWYDPTKDATTTYSYDEAGNLTLAAEGTATVKLFTYNGANEITNVGFTYDANGNMTSDGTNNYIYDNENRITEVKRAQDSHTIATYEYDYFGRRIKATEETETTFFHYDGDDYHVIAESDATGTVTARYYYDDKKQLVSVKKGGQPYYYQYNAHGDVVSLTNTQGQVVNTYKYDPWGKILSANEQVANPYRYAGYRYDEVTGLYYLWHRYYDPELGRFLSKDPDPGATEDSISINPYTYCKDNPLNMVDSDGEAAQLILLAAAAVVTVGIVAYWSYYQNPEHQDVNIPSYDIYNKSADEDNIFPYGTPKEPWKKFGAAAMWSLVIAEQLAPTVSEIYNASRDKINEIREYNKWLKPRKGFDYIKPGRNHVAYKRKTRCSARKA